MRSHLALAAARLLRLGLPCGHAAEPGDWPRERLLTFAREGRPEWQITQERRPKEPLRAEPLPESVRKAQGLL